MKGDMPRSDATGERSKNRTKLVKRAKIIGLGAVLFMIVGLPLFAGTTTYPLLVVSGSSMYPTFHNGDLVYYTSPQFGSIRNGTVIIFIQGDTGFSALDALLKPVLIHRVIGVETVAGKVYYKTQGDANDQPDPFLTPESNVLGVPQAVIPYAGMPVQYITTPYGMVACIGLISLIYVSGVDSKFDEENEKKRLIAAFARHSLNGDITPAQFERVKLAIEYYGEMNLDLLRDPTILSTVDWLKGGGLGRTWKEVPLTCPECGTEGFSITAGDKTLLVCPVCFETRSRRNLAT